MNGKYTHLSPRQLARLNSSPNVTDEPVKDKDNQGVNNSPSDKVRVIVSTGSDIAEREFHCPNPEAAGIILEKILEGFFD